ncbi:protein bfr2-like [Prosopis cineraria]|uniref:protein bfr2-like n=1 Tax=Prosopis cineraria TaxID=364024 RepID=UPI0024103FE7|nr:protein bfr2-like [Prosopis cineraria]
MRVGEPSEEDVEEEECRDKNEAEEEDEDGDKGEDEAEDAHEAGDEDGDEDEDDDGHETAAGARSKEDEDEGSDSKEESDKRQDGKKRRRIDESLMIRRFERKRVEVMSMVAKVMVGEQLHEGKVQRYIFDSKFMANLRDKKLRWSIFEDAKMVMRDQLGYNLINCDYLFLPMLVFNHWFCYCADLKNDKFFILDSLARKLFKEKKMMAGFMRTSIIELLQACNPEKYEEDFQMEMIFEELPKQSNVNN